MGRPGRKSIFGGNTALFRLKNYQTNKERSKEDCKQEK